MKRATSLSVVLAIVIAACSPSTSEPVATDQPAASTTESPNTTLAPTTTAPSATTTSTVGQRAELEEAKALMIEPELSEVLVYDDGEHLSFYVEGPADLVREIVIEFDAVNANGGIVTDTSYVGDLAVDPPPWAVEAQNGNTVSAADYPPPGGTASGEGPGVLVSFVKPIQDSAGGSECISRAKSAHSRSSSTSPFGSTRASSVAHTATPTTWLFMKCFSTPRATE